DIRMIRRTRAAGVPSVTFTQGWDNLTSKTIIGARPDELIVWNERMLEEAVELHGFVPEQITVAGPPHFDPYFRHTGWTDRPRRRLHPGRHRPHRPVAGRFGRDHQRRFIHQH